MQVASPLRGPLEAERAHDDLERFVQAQAPVYPTALAELKAGRKLTHWMWFVFPQLRPLGRSPIAHLYGLHDLNEAKAYWAHPLLGPRLAESVSTVLQADALTAHQIFGTPDDLKFCSCLTLFELATPDRRFAAALDRFYGGRRDGSTQALVRDGMAKAGMVWADRKAAPR